MQSNKNQIIQAIKRKAEQEAAYLAGEFARAAAQDKEAILAAMEFEQWMAQTSEVCLESD